MGRSNQSPGARRDRSSPEAGDSNTISAEKRLIDAFDRLSPQLQSAARYLLDHPHEVALQSMRWIARETGISPATFTRLAHQIGYSGFDDLKKLYYEDVRRYAANYRNKAIKLSETRRGNDALSLATDVASGIARQVDSLTGPEAIRSLVESAQLLGRARTIYCLGQRSSFPSAYAFQYIHSVAGGSSVLLDAPGGSGFDAFRHATGADALLAISVSPYTRVTVELAVHAAGRKVPVVAITDSEVSPLARVADKTIKVSTASQSFFQTMSAVAAASEILATLIAMGSRKAVLDGLKSSEDYFAAFGVYWRPPTRRNRSNKGD